MFRVHVFDFVVPGFKLTRQTNSAISRATPLFISGAVFCFLFAMSYIHFRVHPYRFVLYFLYMLIYPLAGLVFLQFVYNKDNFNSSHHSGSRESSKKDTPNGGTDSFAEIAPQSLRAYISSANSEVLSMPPQTSIGPAATAMAEET